MPIVKGADRTWARWLPTVVSALWLTGCAGGVPQTIREAPSANPSLSAVQKQPESFIGQPVRWGGTILAVHNGPQTTEIEVLARPLNALGEPDAEAESLGRFIAEWRAFKDPSEYPTDRRVTIAGRLARIDTRLIGDYHYAYPVIAVDALHRWSEPIPPMLYPAPPFYPYGSPWFGRYPGLGYGPW